MLILETKDKENFNLRYRYHQTRKPRSQWFYLTYLQSHHSIKLTEKNLKNIFIIDEDEVSDVRNPLNRNLCLKSQTKPADSAQSHQTEFLSVEGTIHCLTETKGNAQEISQIWARWSLIQVPFSPSPNPPWHYRNRFTQHFWLPDNNPSVRYKPLTITYTTPPPQHHLIY